MRRLLTTSGSPASGCMMFGEAPARLAVLVASLLSVGELLGLLDDFQQLFGLVAVACSRVPLQKGYHVNTSLLVGFLRGNIG